MAMALACTVSMAGYLVVVRPIIERHGALRITTLTLAIIVICGSVFIEPFLSRLGSGTGKQ